MNEVLPSDNAVDPPRLQFGLRTMLVLPVVLGLGLGLLELLNVFGVIIAFIATVVFQLAPVPDRYALLRRVGVDLSWGIVMPVLCVLYDPMVLRGAGLLGVFTYLVIGPQMLFLLIWMTLGTRYGSLAAFLTGALSVGSFAALIIAITMLPLSVLGFFLAGIGLLGFTPWMTAYVFGRNAAEAYRFAGSHIGPVKTRVLLAIGAAVAVVGPLLLHLACGPVLLQWVRNAGELWRPF